MTGSARLKWLALAIGIAGVGGAVWSYGSDGIVAALVGNRLSADEKLSVLRGWFHAWGALAPIAYLAVVIAEVVVAPLPGTMLYAPGGAIFGGFVGGGVALGGNVIGAGIACWLMRRLGRNSLAHWFEHGSLQRVSGLLERRGFWVVFLLRLNPLTSSDLVSYAAGLTAMPMWQLLLGTLLGMAPLCFAQAYLAEEFMARMPSLIYPLAVLAALYVAAVLWVLSRMARQPAATAGSADTDAKARNKPASAASDVDSGERQSV